MIKMKVRNSPNIVISTLNKKPIQTEFLNENSTSSFILICIYNFYNSSLKVFFFWVLHHVFRRNKAKHVIIDCIFSCQLNFLVVFFGITSAGLIL